MSTPNLRIIPNWLRSFSALFLVLAGLLPSQCLTAATYYVSQIGGSDGNSALQATSLATPWLTIQHAATNVTAGDTVIIRAGTYREMVTCTNSGTLSAPISFQGYPNETAIISGVDQVTGWVLESPNIYYAPLSLTMGDSNQVFQSGKMMPEARWPNAGPTYPWQNSFTNPSPDWAYINTVGYVANTNGSFTCSGLPNRTDGYWTGAMLHVVSGDGWIFAFPTIIGYTNSTKTIVTDDANGAKSAYAFHAGNEFYLSGSKGELDSPGEWWCDTNNARLYFYSTNTPTNVEAKTRATGFDLNGRSNIQIKNLSFFGCTIQTDTNSNNNVFDGISMKYIMHNQKAYITNRLTLRDHDVLRNSEIAFSSGSLVYLAGSDIRVINNDLHDAGYGVADSECLIGSSEIYQRNLVSHNSLHNEGRALIKPIGSYGIIEYNDLYNGMWLSSDGGIVTDGADASQTVFRYNLVHDVKGPVGHTGNGVYGVYLDLDHSNWVIHNNVIWNIPAYCIDLNARFEYDFVFNNTCAFSGGSITTGAKQYQDAGDAIYNNLFDGNADGPNWPTTDMRFNLFTDPGYTTNTFPGIRTNFFALKTNSVAIDQAVAIPGVTDGYVGSAPDLGALERGGDDWTTQVGRSTNAPLPDPVYNYPNFVFANKIVDGSFESKILVPIWTNAPGGHARLVSQGAWAADNGTHSGNLSLWFDPGTSLVGQVVTNLMPTARYKFYACIRASNTTATITMGVSNYGNPTYEATIPATNGWVIYNLPFVTGATNTTAFVYIKVVSSGTLPVFADDIGVILKSEPPEVPVGTPLVHYPLNETNGLTAFDASGNGLNATVTNGPANLWTNGMLGGALNCVGTNSLITPTINTPAAFTVACWAKSATSNWNANYCLVTQRPAFVLGPVGGTTTMRFLIYTNAASGPIYLGWTPPAEFDATQWHHYAGVYDPSMKRGSFYVDGVMVYTSPGITQVNPYSGRVCIGQDDVTGPVHGLNGAIDDVRIYNYALPALDIQTLVNTSNQLRLHLALDDGAGSAIAWDSTGQGGDGTLTNMNLATAWTNGILNGALNFDGVNDAVITPAIATTPSLTVSCWARSATTNWNTHYCFVSQRPAFVLGPLGGTTTMRFLIYTNASTPVYLGWTPPAAFDITQWHHYAGVYDSSIKVGTLFVDGVPVYTSPGITQINPYIGRVYVGQDDPSGPGHTLNGSIDDVRLYSRVLSPSELLEIAYATSNPPYFAPTPATPSNFRANAIGAASIALAWDAGNSSQTGYKVDYRATGANGWTSVANLAAFSTGYTNTGLQSYTSYDYRIQATNASGSSGFALASAMTPPTAPTGLAPSATNTQVALSWTASPGAISYNVKSSTNNGGPYTVIGANVTSVVYTNSGLTDGTPYFYVVSAVNPNGESTNCSQVSATPGALWRAGWIATASTSGGGDLPTNAIDGSVVSRWSSDANQTNGLWFQVDMVTTQSIKQVVLENCASPGDYPQAYQVNVSDDGTNWDVPVATGAANSSVTVITFEPRTARFVRVTVTGNFSSWWSIYEFNVYPASLPSPWQNRDIGNVVLPGGASYLDNTFTVSASGVDISGTADSFQYVYQSSSADCSVVARVLNVENTYQWAKAGVMIRETTAPGAINAAMFVTAGEGIAFQWRTNTSGATLSTNLFNLSAPYWVKLTRTGNAFLAYYSPDGISYTQMGTAQTIPMATSATLGLAVTSHNITNVCTSTFTNVVVTP